MGGEHFCCSCRRTDCYVTWRTPRRRTRCIEITFHVHSSLCWLPQYLCINSSSPFLYPSPAWFIRWCSISDIWFATMVTAKRRFHKHWIGTSPEWIRQEEEDGQALWELHLSQAWLPFPVEESQHRDMTLIRSKKRVNPLGIVEKFVWEQDC